MMYPVKPVAVFALAFGVLPCPPPEMLELPILNFTIAVPFHVIFGQRRKAISVRLDVLDVLSNLLLMGRNIHAGWFRYFPCGPRVAHCGPAIFCLRLVSIACMFSRDLLCGGMQTGLDHLHGRFKIVAIDGDSFRYQPGPGRQTFRPRPL